jgi:hypothetical protein
LIHYIFPMKTLLLFCIGLLPLLANCQLIAPTTEEEYNYGAVGYKIQLQAKLETKEGYVMKDAEGCEEAERKMEYKLLFRKGENQPCAIIAIFTKIRTAPVYFCIPTANASPLLWDKYYKSLTTGTDNPASQLQFFNLCLAKLMMGIAAGKP